MLGQPAGRYRPYTLAFDTCLDVCSVALIDGADDKVLAYRHVLMSRGHAEALLPLIDETVKEAGLEPDNIGQIAVTCGPGTFTGVRIGIAAARGLAVGVKLPMIGLSSLQAIAACAIAADKPNLPVAALINARRGEVYAAIYASTGEVMVEPHIVCSDELDEILPGTKLLVAGTGAEFAIRQSRRFVASSAPVLPDAAIWGLYAAKLDAPASLPFPLYLRAPDAKLPAKGSQVARTKA